MLNQCYEIEEIALYVEKLSGDQQAVEHFQNGFDEFVLIEELSNNADKSDFFLNVFQLKHWDLEVKVKEVEIKQEVDYDHAMQERNWEL